MHYYVKVGEITRMTSNRISPLNLPRMTGLLNQKLTKMMRRTRQPIKFKTIPMMIRRHKLQRPKLPREIRVKTMPKDPKTRLQLISSRRLTKERKIIYPRMRLRRKVGNKIKII